MGNTEKNKEPLNRTVHNPTTFKYFGSLAGKYTPIHTKEQYIHTYIHTHYREQYWPWDQWRHLFPDFIPRMNLNAMRSIYYVKALSLPHAGLWKWIWRILWPSLLAKNAHPESISFQFKPQRDWLAEAKPCCLYSVDGPVSDPSLNMIIKHPHILYTDVSTASLPNTSFPLFMCGQ